MKRIFQKFTSLILIITTLFNTVISPLSVLAANPDKGDLRYDTQYVKENNKSVSVTEGSYTNPGDVEVRKTVTKLDDNGNYEVKFEARGMRTSSENVNTGPIYGVIVFDRSNSMADGDKWSNAITAARTFASNLHLKYSNANLALVIFGTSASVTREFENRDFTGYDDEDLFGKKPSGGQDGGTNMHDGLIEADRLLSSSIVPENAKKYLLLVSDGAPTYYVANNKIAGSGQYATNAILDATFAKALELKNDGVEIFTIGYDLSNEKACLYTNGYYQQNMCTGEYANYTPATVLQEISSGGFHYHTSDVEHITDVMDDVLDETVVYSPAAKNLVITDNIGSAFTSASDTDNDGVITLTLDSTTVLDSDDFQEVGKFTITIDKDSETNWHKTNNGFSYTYTGLVNPITSTKDPEVYWVKQKYDYSIEYYYNGVIDNNKTESGQKYKDEIVAVNDTQIETNLKTGYKFETVNPTSRQITINNTFLFFIFFKHNKNASIL